MKQKLIELYYKYYMINIYNLIHYYKCDWSFDKVPKDKNEIYVQRTRNDHTNFAVNNKYLIKYKDEKIGLANELHKKGCYFPFFIIKKEQPDHPTNIVLGKHRIYSLLNYAKQMPEEKQSSFLFIHLPNKDTDYEKVTENIFWGYTKEELKPVIAQQKHICGLDPMPLFLFFDRIGGHLSSMIFDNDDIKPNPILNDEELFRQFIESPLDENNIMFKYYEELKEAE